MKIKFPLLIEPIGAGSKRAILALLREFNLRTTRLVEKTAFGMEHTLYEISREAFITLVSDKKMDPMKREFYIVEKINEKRFITRVSFEAIMAEMICDKPQDHTDCPQTSLEEEFFKQDITANVVVCEESPFPFGGVKHRKPPRLAKAKKRRSR